jgi:hypothetical protein
MIDVQFGIGMFFSISAAEPAMINGIREMKPSLTVLKCRCEPIFAPISVTLSRAVLINASVPK